MAILVMFIASLPFVFSATFHDESRSTNERKLYSAFNMPFNDTSVGLQWYINTDHESNFNVRDVWKLNYTGAGVVVTVVDEGLDPTHPELSRNYDKNASYDFVDNDDHPEPTSPKARANMNGHGSKCAGVIAANENNGICGVGLAYNARIGGIRLYVDDMAPDEREAKALMYNNHYVDVYSNSWGPGDRGFEVRGPGYETQRALRVGATKGRGGKGSIFVFAAGNGGMIAEDNCAYNGYVNSIYTIAITGINRDGSVPSFGERCPGIMAAAYSRDTFADRNPLVTMGKNGQCELKFGGTSAATAMASGIIALTLEANPQLTWRDLQHIIARSARFTGIYRPPKNGAGLQVGNYLGFGLMDALKMVTLAKQWKRVPDQKRCEISSSVSKKSDQMKLTAEDTVHVSKSPECGNIRFLEHVQVRVNLEVWPRGDLLLTLESPSKTFSLLTQYRLFDRIRGHSTNLTDWVILTLHHWGEDPQGSWTLKAELGSGGRLFDWTLILYGTSSDPLERNQHALNAAVPVHTNNATPVLGYIVQITSRYSVKMSANTRIKLFGVLGQTGELKLNPAQARTTGRFQYFYFRGIPVGNLTMVHLINRDTKVDYWHLLDLAVRQEGKNPWIVFQYNDFIRRRHVSLKRECRRGYKRNDKGRCEDINDCSSNPCEQICYNHPGGYECACRKGYRKHWWNKHRCADVDECLRSPCEQICNNNPGGYQCRCRKGYHKHRNNEHRCTDVDECLRRPCEQICNNNPGGYECGCRKGYHKHRSNEHRCTVANLQEKVRPRTCKDIQNQEPLQPDGSFFIYPRRNTCNISIEVYCEGMATNNPREYITLRPLYNIVRDRNGTTFFEKVRLDPIGMRIIRNDTQFTLGVRHQYGTASSPCNSTCTGSNCCNSTCTGSNGQVKIDLGGTKLRLNQLEWKSTSDETWVGETTRYDTKGIYYMECGGCNGHCKPDGDLRVVIKGC